MIVVTGAGGSPGDCILYRRIIEKQESKCREFGYQHLVFDLGGLGIGMPFTVPKGDFDLQINGDSLPAATFKASMVKKAFGLAAPEERVCWLDADCIPLLPFDPWLVFTGLDPYLADVAVTLRSAPEIGLSRNPALDYLNSGVVWVRNNSAGRLFRHKWEQASEEMHSDQHGLNVCVGQHCDALWWKSTFGEIVTHRAAMSDVLVLDAMQWNCWHLPPNPDTRILHFKRGIRGQAVNYL